MRKRILSLTLIFALLAGTFSAAAAVQAGTPSVQDNGDILVLTAQNYVITIEKAGFRYSFSRPDGSTIVNAHKESGVSFGKSGGTSYPVVSTEYKGQEGDVVSFLVTNKNGDKADIKIHLFDTYARYEILPVEEKAEPEIFSVEPFAEDEVALLVKGSKNTVDATVWKVEDSKVSGGDYTVEARVKLPANGTMSAGIYSHFNAKNAFHLFFIKKGAVALKRLNAEAGSPAVEFPLIKTIDIKTDTWYTLKLVCEGKQLKGYVDGQLVVEGTDTAATQQQLSGTAGLRADKMDAYYDDFKVTGNDGSTVYYENDFESGSVEQVKQDLTYVMGSQELVLDGAATVVNKYLQLTGNPTASAVTGEAAWTNYTVSADTSFGIGDEETSNGLIFGYQDADNCYGFRFGAGETLSLYKVVAGVETVLKSTTMPYSFDKNYTLKASMKDGTLICYVDGVEKLTAEDSTFTTGKAGILTKVTASKNDNFKVTGALGDLFSTNFDDGKLDAWTTTGKAVVTDGTPEKPEPGPDDGIRYYTIDARLDGGIEYLYGLGDYGATTNTGLGVRETSNVAGVNRLNAGTFTNQNSTNRFISNFTVAPQLGFAQVLFETDDKRVSYTADQTLLGACKTRQVDGLYYFFGDMEQIYSDYKAVRNAAGYVDTKPHYAMFGLGWEAFGSLGWNAYQSSVESTLTDYLNSGYNLTWGVIGSGFWKGDRKALEGTTTSFGIWDDTKDPNGRTDGLPNPRFPGPDELKQFFADNGIKLLVGLRNHLKLPASYKGVNYGGKWDENVDGRFVFEALDKGYFLKNDDGSLYLVSAKYPTGGVDRGPVGVLDAENPEAVKWFSDQADLWGVDGFKEDCMMLQTTHHDDNWNKLQQYMAEEKDNLLIVRNASYCLPGDVLRINDANYGTSNGSFNNSPDRMVINSLAYAASGQSNVYPDIIGGTGANINDPNQQNYIVRNAYFAALCPSQSVGINVLKMNDQARKDAAFKAINWHSTYAPYIYDAALKSYETGYPTSMTPLYIAYPEDPNTYNMINSEKRMFQWLLGESILAAPLFGTDHLTATSRDVYLPEGRWIQYDTGEIFEGPVTLENREAPIDQMPAFVGGKGVLVGEDMGNKGNYFIEVFPIAEKGTVYDYTFVDGETTSVVAMNMDGFNPNTLVITDTTEQKTIAYTVNENNRAVRFNYEPGHSYELTGGESEGKPYALEVVCSDVFVGENIVDSVRLTLVMDDFTRIEDLTGYEIAFIPEDESALSMQDGKLVALKAGTARFKVTAAKDGESTTSNWASVSIKERAIEITRPAFDDTLCTGSFLVSGQLMGVDEVEVFLTGSEGGEKLYTAEPVTENGSFSAEFSGVEDGSFLLYAKDKSGSGVEVSSPLSVDTANIVFYDAFDGVSGFNWDKSLDGAAIAVNTEKGTLSGTASMTSDNKVASVITAAGEPISGEYSVKTTMTFKGGAASAGLVFGYQDDKNYFHVRLDKSNAGGKAQLYQFVNGTASKAEPEAAISCRDNQPYLLEAKINGKNVQYYLDNKLIVEKTYDKDVTGKVGVRVYNVAADFNEIKVTTGDRKERAVTSHYMDEDGKALSAEVTVWKPVGSTYRTEEKRFDGYILIETPDNAEGTVSDEGIEVVYRYHKIKTVTGVSLDKTSANIYSNTAPDTVQLTAVVEPVDADKLGLIWSSDHPETATVDENGLVTAVADGKATITVTTVDGGHTAVCAVDVSTYYSPSTPTTTTKTVKNDDGSTTKIVTNKRTGTVTATTKWPDGKTVETVTTKNGDKTIAVIRQDGKRAAEINVPAVVAAPEKIFTDVPEGHWAKEAVDFGSGLGLFSGGSDGDFSGGAPMTRGMLVTVLHRLSGTLPCEESSFADVKPDSWYAEGVAWATGNGIVTGNGTGFDPEGNITRESLTVMLWRYAELLGLSTTIDGVAADAFNDAADVSTWAADAMCWAVESGILKGSGGNLAPGTTATRAEVAVMLERFIGLITK